MYNPKMPYDLELDRIVSGLVDSWCERRALGALRIVLSAWWPPPTGYALTDDWERLRSGLRHARAMAKEQMTDEEKIQLNQAIAMTDQALHHKDENSD
jgi:hypothetical protein